MPTAPTLPHALDEAVDWLRALATDGPDLTINAHRKAAHEAHEFAEDPSLEELADVLICLIGAADHRGWSQDDIAHAVSAKVKVNQARTWAQQADGTWQHATGPDSGAVA